jgi:hypothetical protein
VQQVDVVVGGVRVVRLDLARFYLPMPPRGDGAEPWQFIPVRYLAAPVIARPRQYFEFHLLLSGPGECTFIPLADVWERSGQTINP